MSTKKKNGLDKINPAETTGTFHFLTCLIFIFSLPPSTQSFGEGRVNKHGNLSLIYPFPCDSGSLKWQSLGYDLQLEWFSISHHCHLRSDSGLRSSGTFSPPYVLSLLPSSIVVHMRFLSFLPSFLPVLFHSPHYSALDLPYVSPLLCFHHLCSLFPFSIHTQQQNLTHCRFV